MIPKPPKLSENELAALRAQAYPDILNDDGVEWKVAKIAELQGLNAQCTEALSAANELVEKLRGELADWKDKEYIDAYMDEAAETLQEFADDTRKAKAELAKYKQAARAIFDDPIAYMENKSIRWKERAEKAEAELAAYKATHTFANEKYDEAAGEAMLLRVDLVKYRADYASACTRANEAEARIESAPTLSLTRASNCTCGDPVAGFPDLKIGESITVALVRIEP